MAHSDAAGLRAHLLSGGVIPAHPLALDADLRLDERRQRALTRYYLDAGAAGVAVGVHTTQFEIHSPGAGLYRPVLALAAETVRAWEEAHATRVLRIAGLVGRTRQAAHEAEIARGLGYDAGLLSLAALPDAGDDELIAHCKAVAAVLPLFGFYLQPAVGGRPLGLGFWRRFFEIEDVAAVKVAPFDRYATHDVARALAESGRAHEIALYTGNDDAIVHDLLTEFRYADVQIRFSGGLLGHWAYGTQRAVALMDQIRALRLSGADIPAGLLRLGAEITDMNGAVFDAAHRFAGCLSGIHEMLRRDGFLEAPRCLGRGERLSPGQSEEIDRVRSTYPHLLDTTFIEPRIDTWMK